MADPKRPSFQFGGVEFGVGTQRQAEPVRAGTPFRILIMADFKGRGLDVSGDAKPLKTIQVDRDNFEEILAQVSPALENFVTRTDGTGETVAFRTLEDFEPDHLLASLSLFDKLRAVKRRLLKSQTFAAAAEEVRGWLGASGKETLPPVKETPSAAPVDTENLLEQALSVTEQESDVSPGGINVEKMVRDIVRPYLEEKPDPQQAELVATVEAMQAELMRKVLHHRDFQRLEASWRALYWLVKRLETGGTLQIHILDLSKSGVLQDFTAASNLKMSRLWKTIVDESVGTAGAKPWSLIIGDYEFGATEDDALLAGCLAGMAAHAGAPFIAGGHPSLYGTNSVSVSQEPNDWTQAIDPAANQAWGEFRTRASATSFGLVSPRFMLRYPYDRNSVKLESIPFDEITGSNHEGYLWGNGAFILAALLGEAFTREGWKMQPGQQNEVSGIPVHVYKDDGESVMKPCAEALLATRAVEKIAQSGVMPLVSVKDQDKVRLEKIQSISINREPLAGRWS